MNVKPIQYKFGPHFAPRQDSAKNPRIAMVEARHCIETMSGPANASLDRAHRVFVSPGAMPERGDYSLSYERFGDSRTLSLAGSRHDNRQFSGGALEVRDFAPVKRAEYFRIEHPWHRGVQIRPLDVDAIDRGAPWSQPRLLAPPLPSVRRPGGLSALGKSL